MVKKQGEKDWWKFRVVPVECYITVADTDIQNILKLSEKLNEQWDHKLLQKDPEALSD